MRCVGDDARLFSLHAAGSAMRERSPSAKYYHYIHILGLPLCPLRRAARETIKMSEPERGLGHRGARDTSHQEAWPKTFARRDPRQAPLAIYPLTSSREREVWGHWNEMEAHSGRT